MPVELIHYCKKCKLKLNHDAIVMTLDKIEKIRCNTCKTVSTYKTPKPKKEIVSKPTAAIKKTSFSQEELVNYNQSEPKKYKMSDNYKLDDAIYHPKFGGGFVIKTEKDRITVKFHEEGIKVLVQNQAK